MGLLKFAKLPLKVPGKAFKGVKKMKGIKKEGYDWNPVVKITNGLPRIPQITTQFNIDEKTLYIVGGIGAVFMLFVIIASMIGLFMFMKQK